MALHLRSTPRPYIVGPLDRETQRIIIGGSLVLMLGVALRYWAMSIGHNFDFDSYCIVGDLVRHGQSVYANTKRYNYAPPFFLIQGLLYRLSELFTNDQVGTYRVLMVSYLTGIDVCIAALIATRVSLRGGALFFLNPVSVLITGYSNQFDNMAVLFALLAAFAYHPGDEFDKRDLKFVLFFTLSLASKHVLFVLPAFILMRQDLSWKKRALYAFVPPILFLLSFVPSALRGPEALNGIIQHVFLYRGWNNAPLLRWLYTAINLPEQFWIVAFGLLMCTVGFVVRKQEYSFVEVVSVYFIALVAFSSAIANQYLAIPMAGLCILATGAWKYVYAFLASLFVFLDGNGLAMRNPEWIQSHFGDAVAQAAEFYNRSNGYVILTWILFATLAYVLIRHRMAFAREEA